ncbi:SseB family protein [Actinomadura sp. WMMB 499]|uniref:SseB family protein n=1 Tax=Actinomadura sp. WMMB 499 TaxID=1219491 RepID=UPI001244E10E|nr:SseB family protein [Actinomadura sp. WMMB 499]QFG24693.1 hypothetical protein F7P10_29660 [Actinomadura sp. WMMB 499]
MATVADAWRPTSELERRLHESVRAGDQEGYFRVLAGAELLLPVAPDAVDDVLANTAQPTWPTQEEDGRVHVLTYTSAAAMRACLGPAYRHFMTLRFGDVAQNWPDAAWWLAVDVPGPGVDAVLPIEARLPSWFVRQVAEGDGRPPRVGRPGANADGPWEELRGQHRDLPREARRPDFQPANDVERELLRAAANNDHDLFLQTLAGTEVLLPVPEGTDYALRPGRPGFPWQTRDVDGATVVPVFTSPERLIEAARAAGTGTEYIRLPFTVALRYWPHPDWQLAINSGSPAGGTVQAQQLPGLATWADQRAAQRMTDGFEPQNDIEQRLFDAARRRDTETFYQVLLSAQVLVPAEPETPWGITPDDPGFPWQPVNVHGRTSIQVFTSLKWMNDALSSSRFVMPTLLDLVTAWPESAWTFVLNPGTPIDASMPGDQVRALAGPPRAVPEEPATPPSAATPPPPDAPAVPVAPPVPAADGPAPMPDGNGMPLAHRPTPAEPGPPDPARTNADSLGTRVAPEAASGPGEPVAEPAGSDDAQLRGLLGIADGPGRPEDARAAQPTGFGSEPRTPDAGQEHPGHAGAAQGSDAGNAPDRAAALGPRHEAAVEDLPQRGLPDADRPLAPEAAYGPKHRQPTEFGQGTPPSGPQTPDARPGPDAPGLHEHPGHVTEPTDQSPLPPAPSQPADVPQDATPAGAPGPLAPDALRGDRPASIPVQAAETGQDDTQATGVEHGPFAPASTGTDAPGEHPGHATATPAHAPQPERTPGHPAAPGTPEAPHTPPNPTQAGTNDPGQPGHPALTTDLPGTGHPSPPESPGHPAQAFDAGHDLPGTARTGTGRTPAPGAPAVPGQPTEPGAATPLEARTPGAQHGPSEPTPTGTDTPDQPEHRGHATGATAAQPTDTNQIGTPGTSDDTRPPSAPTQTGTDAPGQPVHPSALTTDLPGTGHPSPSEAPGHPAQAFDAGHDLPGTARTGTDTGTTDHPGPAQTPAPGAPTTPAQATEPGAATPLEARTPGAQHGPSEPTPTGTDTPDQPGHQAHTTGATAAQPTDTDHPGTVGAPDDTLTAGTPAPVSGTANLHGTERPQHTTPERPTGPGTPVVPHAPSDPTQAGTDAPGQPVHPSALTTDLPGTGHPSPPESPGHPAQAFDAGHDLPGTARTGTDTGTTDLPGPTRTPAPGAPPSPAQATESGSTTPLEAQTSGPLHEPSEPTPTGTNGPGQPGHPALTTDHPGTGRTPAPGAPAVPGQPTEPGAATPLEARTPGAQHGPSEPTPTGTDTPDQPGHQAHTAGATAAQPTDTDHPGTVGAPTVAPGQPGHPALTTDLPGTGHPSPPESPGHPAQAFDAGHDLPGTARTGTDTGTTDLPGPTRTPAPGAPPSPAQATESGPTTPPEAQTSGPLHEPPEPTPTGTDASDRPGGHESPGLGTAAPAHGSRLEAAGAPEEPRAPGVPGHTTDHGQHAAPEQAPTPGTADVRHEPFGPTRTGTDAAESGQHTAADSWPGDPGDARLRGLPGRTAEPADPGGSGQSYAGADAPATEQPGRADGEGARALRAVPEAEPGFEPGNRIDQELYEATLNGDSDAFLRILLNANVLVPIPEGAPLEVTPIQRDFRWDAALRDDASVRVFTSLVRLREVLPETRFVYADFRELIGVWPRADWAMLLNPGTRIGASLRGEQVRALSEWALRVGLVQMRPEAPLPPPRRPEPEPEPRARQEPEPEPRQEPRPAADPDDRVSQLAIMQKVVPHGHVGWYLEQGYDRVGGFVHLTSDVAELQTPTQLYEALGLLYEDSPFTPADEGVYVIRWPAYCPDVYRVPFGGATEAEMAAWGESGWVVERPPFVGTGFAPGSAGSIREFKVDSIRLPYGSEMYFLGPDRSERFVAMYDPDRLGWLRPEAGAEGRDGRTEAAQ